ncbi:MAG: MarR family winged helix-turn-helix transcriptional regulator [Microthrixaceae bacterium]
MTSPTVAIDLPAHPDCSGDPVAQIESAVVALLRRANDPRNRKIYEMAGTDIEKAGAVMLARSTSCNRPGWSELASAAGVTISTASRQVSRLVEQGYVARSVDPLDARASLHRLTPAGQACADAPASGDQLLRRGTVGPHPKR